MEEKKTLWIVLLVSFFVLVVFGSAMLLYHHPKAQNSSEQELRYLKEIAEAPSIEKVDPDLWSRQLEKVPDYEDLDELGIKNEKKSITFVDGTSVENGRSYIDVSDLNSSKTIVKEGKKLPKEIAKQLGLEENKKDVVEEEFIVEKSVERTLTEPKNTTKMTISKRPIPTVTKKNKKVEKREAPDSIQTVYWVQTASLSSRINAEKAREKLVSRHMKVEIFTKETTVGLTHRVRVGPFKNNTEAEYWLKSIKGITGFENSYISQERIRT